MIDVALCLLATGRLLLDMPAAASVPEDDVPRFKPATVQAIIKTSFKDGRTQGQTHLVETSYTDFGSTVSNHALTLCAEYIRLFTLDASVVSSLLFAMHALKPLSPQKHTSICERRKARAAAEHSE